MNGFFELITKDKVGSIGATRYLRLASLIEDFIQNNSNRESAHIPSERTIARTLGVSRGVVTRAFEQLEKQNLIVRKQGVGTLIVPKIGYSSDQREGLTEQLNVSGKQVTSQWLYRTKKAANAELARIMEVPEGELLSLLKRIRLIDNIPISIETIYVPHTLLPHPEEVEQSLYAVFRQKNIEIKHKKVSVTAKMSSPSITALFQLKAAIPLLYTKEINRDKNNRVIEYNKVLCRGDIYALNVDI